MGPQLIKIYKHATVLIEYLANGHTILQTSAKPSVSAMQSVVQEAMQFAERTKKEPPLTDIMNNLELLEAQRRNIRYKTKESKTSLSSSRMRQQRGGLPKNHCLGLRYSTMLNHRPILPTKLLPTTKTIKS